MTVDHVDLGVAGCVGCGRRIEGQAHRCGTCRAEYLCGSCIRVCCRVPASALLGLRD